MCLTVCVRMCAASVDNCSSVSTHVSLLSQIVMDHEQAQILTHGE